MRDYLRKLRENSHLSMQDIADKIGISRQYYQQIEAGERQKKMDITLVSAIANLFSVPIGDIVNEENKIASIMKGQGD